MDIDMDIKEDDSKGFINLSIEETDTPTISSIETKETEEEEPSQDGDQSEDETETSEDEEEELDDNSPDEKNIPFHKHPRWKEREDSHKKDMEAMQSEISNLKQSKQPPVKTAPPQAFYDLFGTELPDGTYEKFKSLIDISSSDAINKERAKNKEYSDTITKQQSEYNNGIEDAIISNKLNGTAFKKFFAENLILTADGKSYDFEKGAKFFKLANPKKSIKKDLISSISKSKTSTTQSGKLIAWKQSSER